MFLVLLLMSLYGAWRVSKFDLCQTLSFHSVSFILPWDNHGGKVLGSFGTPWICCYNPKLQFFYTSLLAWLKHLTRLCLQQNGLAGHCLVYVLGMGTVFYICLWSSICVLDSFGLSLSRPGLFTCHLGLTFSWGPNFMGQEQENAYFEELVRKILALLCIQRFQMNRLKFLSIFIFLA